MKILFTSDLHGELLAYHQFANLLLRPEFDLGIIAGDLDEEYLTKAEVMSLLGLKEDDLLDELVSPDPPEKIDIWGSVNAKHYKAALEFKARPLRKILSKCGKPVLFVKGNHDKADWKSEDFLVNIGQTYSEHLGYRFVGYEYTELDKTYEGQMDDMAVIEHFMTDNTILVTHAPAFGTLDLMRINDSQKGAVPIHIGSKAILSLKKRKPPKLHLFGHIHSAFGIQGNCVNGAYSPTVRKMISIEKVQKGFVIKSLS